MRPVRLVLEGFGPFRERTEIDLADTDLFALVGSTGSGKSSIIDGITFALYGSVARYDDERLVAPVINQRSTTARVDLVLTVGEDWYRAFREVGRTSRGGATVKEARLERGDATILEGGPTEPLATGKGVTTEVERLLGLTFGQFTTCVVLPQGEFARFLHETPARREDLLKRLLDLGLYDAIGQRARARAADAASKLEIIDEQLEQYRASEAADPESLDRRVRALESLLVDVEAATPRLEDLARQTVEAEVQAAAAERWVGVLGGVAPPEHLESLDETVITADLELAAAQKARASAEQRVEAIEARAEDLPSRRRLEAAKERRLKAETLDQRYERGAAMTADARVAAEAAVGAADEARAHLTSAEAALADVEREQAAHALAAELTVGDPCPVCHREITEMPHLELGDVTARRDAVVAARKLAAEADRVRDEATTAATTLQTKLDALDEQRRELADEMSRDPEPSNVDTVLALWQALDDELTAARATQQAAREQEGGAVRRREKVEKLLQSAWSEFDDQRDRLATLEPPPAERADLAASWRALVAWSAEQAAVHAAIAETARAAARTAADARRTAQDEVIALCTAAEVVVGDAPARDAVVDALAATRAERTAAEDRRRELADRLDAREVLAADRAVSEQLGRLLRAGGFVSWLLGEAMSELVAGATARLHQLAQGRYSLEIDDKGAFLVVDHNNADERRLARTLSGGETFLASLALALALADEVARLSAVGAPRLESIFLDEGFGTLDPDTLDVAIGAIEELQATGRLVGLVSHVPEVAERVPVRFEVHKDAASASSTVERVLT
jgi:exonuclease SbcC